jgi:hypothetical protein
LVHTYKFFYSPAKIILISATGELRDNAIRLELTDPYCLVVLTGDAWVYCFIESDVLADSFLQFLSLNKIIYRDIERGDLIRMSSPGVERRIIGNQDIYLRYIRSVNW